MRQIFQATFSYFNRLPFDFRGLGFILFIVVVLFFLQVDKNNHQTIVSKSDVTQIKGTLRTKPFIGGSKQGDFLNIHLNEFAEFKFSIAGWRYSAFHFSKFVSESDVGDTILLGVSNYDYATKILKTKGLTFSDKIMDYTIIEPYSVSGKDVSYLSISDTIKAYEVDRKSTRRTWITLLVIEAIVVVFYILFKLLGGVAKIKKMFTSQ